jgi:hypothetical protein
VSVSVSPPGSVAPPEKLTVSPTFQRRLEDGLAMVAVGGVLPAVTDRDRVGVARPQA